MNQEKPVIWLRKMDFKKSPEMGNSELVGGSYEQLKFHQIRLTQK